LHKVEGNVIQFSDAEYVLLNKGLVSSCLLNRKEDEEHTLASQGKQWPTLSGAFSETFEN